MGLVDGFTDRDVLELGPLEAGHTYVLDRLEARSITAVEANGRAYLKCLVAKEIFGIPRAHFLLGDCLEYLRSTNRHYDIGVACGILYHMTNPVELLELLARRCDALFLWTVFYDPDFVAKHPGPAAKFSEAVSMEHAGFKYTVHRYNYGTSSLDSKARQFLSKWAATGVAFTGGGDTYSYWMEEPAILAALRRFGFTDVETEEQPMSTVLLLCSPRGNRSTGGTGIWSRSHPIPACSQKRRSTRLESKCSSAISRAAAECSG